MVEIGCSGFENLTGLGYTYTSATAARLVEEVLADTVLGTDAMEVTRQWWEMVRAVRNIGRPGIASMAIAAVDCALWDLKARLLGVPLVHLLGNVRDEVPVYGSGGFTSMSERELVSQTGAWVHKMGIPRVKIKIGTECGKHPATDVARVGAVRREIGEEAELFVDANGAYRRKQAVSLAARLADLGVTWFEEPVSSTTSTAYGRSGERSCRRWRRGSTGTTPLTSRRCARPRR